jgi:capsular exopolysaccharide synthesis family protein
MRSPIPEWEQEEIHLRDYLEVIIRRRWLIATFLVLTFVTTLILTLAQSKRYESFATLEINQSEQNITKFEDLLAETPPWLSERYYETQVSLITNPALLGRVVDRLDLAAHPVVRALLFEPGDSGVLRRLREWIADSLKALIPADQQRAPSEDPSFTEEMETRDTLLEYLEEGLEVSSSRMSSLITVTFLSEDRRLSRDVVEALCEEFINWKMEQKLEASQRAQLFLMKQIDQAKINLERAEEAMNRFAKQAGIVSMDGKLNSVYLELEEMNAAIAAAETELIAKEAAYHQALADGPSTLPQVLASPMIADLKTEYARLQSEYEQLSVTFQDGYPAVQSIKARLQSVAARIAAEEHKIFLGLKNEYLTVKAKVARLKEGGEAQKQRALNLNERATQFRIMAREVETNKNIYESLLGRSREIESMVGVSSSNINIVSPAVIPILPAKPNVKLNLLLAIAVGLLGGIGLAFFLEYFTDTVSNPEEISDRFQIPILGIVPLVKDGDCPPEKTFLLNARSPLSEALRTTRVSLQLSGCATHVRSILITSNHPGEGKTTLTSNLALTFAQAGEKVVVVDADMRKPRIHKVFSDKDLTSQPGLSSFLAGLVTKGIIYQNGIENLHYIPAGPIPPNPVELLASQRFATLMRFLESKFDRVIVDAPPHQGFADVLVLSQCVGGVVLAASMGEIKRAELRQFKKSILNTRGTILGCIINKVDITRRYGYQSYYQYYQYYRYNEDGSGRKLKRLTHRSSS